MPYDIELAPETVILNTYKGSKSDLTYVILLVTKQYIYAVKHDKESTKFSLIKLTNRLYDVKRLECIIAQRDNKMYKYQLKRGLLE